MLTFIKNLFNKKEQVEEVEVAKEEESYEKLLTNEEMYELVDFSIYPDPKISNIKEEPVLLILDDIEDSEILYNIDFKNMKRKYGINPYEEMKVVKCLGPDAGYIAYKYILDHHIDFAVLDITLGKHVKLKTGDVLEIDGVDIGIEILKRNPDAKVVFCSAHTMNPRNPLMRKYITKFNEYTGNDINDYFVYKNSNRMEAIYNIIKDSL